MAERSKVFENLEHECNELYTEFCREIQLDSGKFEMFRITMQSLPQQWRMIAKYLTPTKLDNKRVNEYLDNGNYQLWNAFDYDFLGFLITQCGGSVKLQEKMAMYQEKVKDMRTTVTIKEFINWKMKQKCFIEDDDCPILTLKLNWNPEKLMMSDLQEILVKTLSGILQYMDIVTYCKLVDYNSELVTVTWFVSTATIIPLNSTEILDIVQKNAAFYESSGVVSLTFMDFILYTCTTQTMLWNASREGNDDQVKILCSEEDADINHKYEVSSRTVLQCAAKYGHMNIIQSLLERGADIDYRDANGYTALIIALQSGKKDVATLLIEKGANLNFQDRICGSSALLLAAEKNYCDVVSKMLEKNVDVSVKNTSKKTALILSAERGHDRVVSVIMTYLQSSNSDVREVLIEQDLNGCTALHAAAKMGHVEIVKILITHKEIIGIVNENDETALIVAVNCGHSDIVAILEPHFQLELDKLKEEEKTQLQEESKNTHGAVEKLQSAETGDSNVPGEDNVTRRQTKSQLTGTDRKPLHIMVKLYHSWTLKDDFRFVHAAERADIKTLKYFLEQKHYDPNIPKPDLQSWTALMWAAKHGHLDVINLLLKHGASVNITAENGFSCLIMASREGHYEVVKTLLNNVEKPHINAYTNEGKWAALMWACQKYGSKKYSDLQKRTNHFKIAQALIESGADINQEAANGWTPLMQSSQDGNIEIVKYLCQFEHININHQSHSTWSALSTACRKEREDIVKILVDRGADVTMTQQGGVTAIHIACYKGLTRALKYMLSALSKREEGSFNINATDDWDMTPLMLAIKAGHKETANYLVTNAGADIHIRAMKYHQWSAIFFSLQNQDIDTYRLLVGEHANTDFKDEYGNTIVDVAGLSSTKLLSNKFYKQLDDKDKEQFQRL